MGIKVQSEIKQCLGHMNGSLSAAMSYQDDRRQSVSVCRPVIGQRLRPCDRKFVGHQGASSVLGTDFQCRSGHWLAVLSVSGAGLCQWTASLLHSVPGPSCRSWSGPTLASSNLNDTGPSRREQPAQSVIRRMPG